MGQASFQWGCVTSLQIVHCELPPVGTGWGTGFFVMDRGVWEMGTYIWQVIGRVVRVVRWFLFNDMAG